MSFAIFKQSMLGYMKNQDGIKAFPEFAKKITQEYDMCIRRGLQTINNIPIQTPNIALMETLVTLACTTALSKQKGKHVFADDIGKGVLGYWTGATLVTGIPPIIPAPGSMLNITTIAAMTTSPGTWTPVGPLSPVDDSGLFLDRLIASMMSHVPTIQGLYMTTSLYPGAPPFVAPGVLTWTGFTVPPAGPSVPKPVVNPPIDLSIIDTLLLTVEELLEIIPDNNNTVAGAAAVVAATGTEILTDDGEEKNSALAAIQRQSAPDVSPDLSDTPDEITPSENAAEAIPSQCGVGLNYEAELSPNLKVRSLSLDVTFPHKIKAAHGLTVDDIVCNLKHVAVNIVEPILAKYPNVVINSAFRGTPSLVGRVSQHEIGEAIDIQFTGLGPRDYLPISKWIVETLPFDQFIFEHGNSIWLHITCKRTGTNRKKKMTMINKKYEMGIKCYY
tara:strand:- start:53 stop:1387 length:1335 start_codon:yes stop_codon:yes gene_type:complete